MRLPQVFELDIYIRWNTSLLTTAGKRDALSGGIMQWIIIRLNGPIPVWSTIGPIITTTILMPGQGIGALGCKLDFECRY